MLSFIVLTDGVGESLRSKELPCIPYSLGMPYLLCSIRCINDLGIISLELLNLGLGIKYAYTFLSKALHWVLVMRGEEFLGLNGPSINDLITKCTKPYIYIPLNRIGAKEVKSINTINEILRIISKLLRHKDIATFRIKSLPNYLIINISNEDSKNITRTLRTLQEKLVRLNIYSVIKCPQYVKNINHNKKIGPISNLLTKYV